MGDFNTHPGDTDVLAGTPTPANESVTFTPPTFDTGFDRETKELVWPGAVLLDTFADVHRWGENENVATSRNAVRCEWIDMMFYSKDTLQIGARSENPAPHEALPNRTEGSDHTPIWAYFDFTT